MTSSKIVKLGLATLALGACVVGIPSNAEASTATVTNRISVFEGTKDTHLNVKSDTVRIGSDYYNTYASKYETIDETITGDNYTKEIDATLYSSAYSSGSSSFVTKETVTLNENSHLEGFEQVISASAGVSY